MLDDYAEKQKNSYNLMINEIRGDRVSHAYLVDENNNAESFDIVMAFIKEILCNGLDQMESLALRKRIDDGNYPEIKIIEPDGLLIKKQQLLDLQREFSMSAIEGNRRVYVIRDADKMRTEAANSMLKFLEEPDNHIIAILMTNNIDSLLPTIVSRCQVIHLDNNDVFMIDSELENLALEFVTILENDGIKAIIAGHDLIFNTINSKNRERFITFFDKIIDMYYDILKILRGCKKIKYCDYYDRLSLIAELCANKNLLGKIDILLDYKDTVKNNVNMSLLCDSLIVRIGGI